MLLNRDICMRIGSLIGDLLAVVLQLSIIYDVYAAMPVETASFYERGRKRHTYYDYIIKNREISSRRNTNDEREYDGALTYRDFLENYRSNDNTNFKETASKIRASHSGKNQIPRSFGGRSFDGMTRILTFPLKKNDNPMQGGINDFEAGNPAADCLEGGVDAGVINGALKIGIGIGLAPGCGASTEPTPRMVPVPVFVPRPIPVPVGVPQPYPVAIDVPRPVAIRVPQPIPFPFLNMGPMPITASMQQFPSRLITGKAW